MFHVKQVKKLKFCYILVIFILFSACGEDSIKEDTSAFNKIIENNDGLKSAEDVLILYYKYARPGEEKGYTVTSEKLPRHRYMVILIKDNMADDSMQGEKFTMLVEQKEKFWKVITVERNWKCYPRRGHSSWGTEPCG
jgi:hypothetical protein